MNPLKKTFPAGALLAGLCLCLWLSTTPARATWSDVVVFGDSLSDVGNVHQRSTDLTFGLFPNPDDRYFRGRFSNGPLWIEQLADGLGLDASTRSYRAAGTNYAHGGATTGGGTASLGVIRNVGWQVDEYLVREAQTPDDQTLVVLWAGANNFLDGGTDTTGPANDLAGHLQRLYDAGARDFLVPNLPPLGSTPRFAGNPTTAAQRNATIAQHNAQLAQQLTAFAALPGVAVYGLDIATLFDQLLTDPGGAGITNTAGQAIDLPSGADASGHLFWDDVHPTVTGHALVADAAWDLLLPGDYDGDAFVSQSDLDLVLLNWGANAGAAGVPAGWVRQQPDGLIAQAALDEVLLNWGTGQAGGPSAAAVPEPTAAVFFVGVVCLRKRRAGPHIDRR